MPKPNLILIPGWNIEATIFKPFLYEIENHFECHLVTPSLPTYAQNVEKILDYINSNDLKNIQLLGWSMGGQIALLVAEKIELDRLILLNSAAIFNRNEQQKQTFYAQCLSNFEQALKYFHKLMGKLSIEESILLRKHFINDQTTALSLLRELHRADLTLTAKNIKCPTIIIHSPADKIIPYSEAQLLATLIQNSQLYTLAGDFHFPFFNACAKISAILLGEKAE